jgi:hypothetical protein
MQDIYDLSDLKVGDQVALISNYRKNGVRQIFLDEIASIEYPTVPYFENKEARLFYPKITYKSGIDRSSFPIGKIAN